MKILAKHTLLLFLVVIATNCTTIQTTKIISYNIRYDNDWDTENSWKDRRSKIVSLLKGENPAIFGVQEGLINQVSYIDSSFSEYKYIGIGRDGEDRGEFSPIFYDSSKFTLLKSNTFWLSETPDSISIGWDAMLNRICTYGLFENKITSEKLWILNTHFDHKGELARKNAAKLILKKIQQINSANYPLVLMGDFNLTPEENPIQTLKTALDDAIKISKTTLEGPTGTFNGFNNKEKVTTKIDYFFTKNLTVQTYTHINDRLDNSKHISDHLPIMITINQ